MASWIDVNAELPSANRVVDVCVVLTHGGVTQLRGYRLATRGGHTESLWLNAITHQPFPEGWRVIKWRAMEGDASAHTLRMSDLLLQKHA
jgi:hypothetical protein